jgi:hypothetical protein
MLRLAVHAEAVPDAKRVFACLEGQVPFVVGNGTWLDWKSSSVIWRLRSEIIRESGTEEAVWFSSPECFVRTLSDGIVRHFSGSEMWIVLSCTTVEKCSEL